MEFHFSPDQQRWHDAAIAFAREMLSDDLLARDEQRLFWREGWTRCARLGLQGLPISREFGGQGFGLPETIAAMEGLGYGCEDNGLLFGLNASLWTVSLPLFLFGSDDQKRRFLPGLCDGSLIGANAASEPDAGSDIFAMTTRAERDHKGWVLSGHKTWCTNGPITDLFLLYATTDLAKGVLGLSAFVVPRDSPGLRIVRDIPKMGLRTVLMGEIALESCGVPSEALLGREGRGAEIFQASMEYERGAIMASALGTMRRQLERCIAHARERTQFGRPIGKNQAVSHRIAEMALRLETCRLMVYKAGWLKAAGIDATMASAMAKLHVSECFVQNSLDAVRLFGASGYTADLGVERELRDSVGSLIYSGTNDILKNVIAKELKL